MMTTHEHSLLLEVTRLREIVAHQRMVIEQRETLIKMLAAVSQAEAQQIVNDIEARLIEMKKSAAVEPSQIVGYRVAFNQAIKAVSNYWEW